MTSQIPIQEFPFPVRAGGAFQHCRPGLRRQEGRGVVAPVGQNTYLVGGGGVRLSLEIGDQSLDHPFLVVRWNDHPEKGMSVFAA
jgi:hypothetical protein